MMYFVVCYWYVAQSGRGGAGQGLLHHQAKEQARQATDKKVLAHAHLPRTTHKYKYQVHNIV